MDFDPDNGQPYAAGIRQIEGGQLLPKYANLVADIVSMRTCSGDWFSNSLYIKSKCLYSNFCSSAIYSYSNYSNSNLNTKNIAISSRIYTVEYIQ